MCGRRKTRNSGKDKRKMKTGCRRRRRCVCLEGGRQRMMGKEGRRKKGRCMEEEEKERENRRIKRAVWRRRKIRNSGKGRDVWSRRERSGWK